MINSSLGYILEINANKIKKKALFISFLKKNYSQLYKVQDMNYKFFCLDFYFLLVSF